MRLANSALAVEEENRRRFCGAVADLHARRKGEAIGLADDEVFKAAKGRSASGELARAVAATRFVGAIACLRGGGGRLRPSERVG